MSGVSSVYPLDTSSTMGYSVGMEERHAANAINKARQAVDTIERDLYWLWKDDPDFAEVTDLNSLLRFTHYTLFGYGRVENPKLTAAVWAIIGGFYSINHADGSKVTVFDTSRPFIEAELLNRVKETNPPVVDDSDPFAGLEHTTLDDINTVRR